MTKVIKKKKAKFSEIIKSKVIEAEKQHLALVSYANRKLKNFRKHGLSLDDLLSLSYKCDTICDYRSFLAYCGSRTPSVVKKRPYLYNYLGRNSPHYDPLTKHFINVYNRKNFDILFPTVPISFLKDVFSDISKILSLRHNYECYFRGISMYSPKKFKSDYNLHNKVIYNQTYNLSYDNRRKIIISIINNAYVKRFAKRNGLKINNIDFIVDNHEKHVFGECKVFFPLC